MTFERCYSVIRPHKASSLNTVKRAKITIFFIVIFSCLYSIPRLFYSMSTGRLCFSFANVLSLRSKQVYFWIRMCLHFLVPFVLILIMNSFIIHTLQNRSSLFKSEDQSQGKSQGRSGKSKIPERQIYITLLLISFSYLILWSCLLAKAMYFSPKTTYAVAATYLYTEIAENLHYMNYGINFFLYVISGPKFRNDLLVLF